MPVKLCRRLLDFLDRISILASMKNDLYTYKYTPAAFYKPGHKTYNFYISRPTTCIYQRFIAQLRTGHLPNDSIK